MDRYRRRAVVTPPEGGGRNWPSTSTLAGGKLRRNAPALRQQGIEVEFTKDKTGRWIRLSVGHEGN